MVIIPIILTNQYARKPIFAKQGDACADLHATENVVIHPQETKVVGTGIALQLPECWEAQIRPRSGLAAKHAITVLNSPGTIDSGYRGEVKIILSNLGMDTFEIEIGDRIAQIAIRPVPTIEFVQVKYISETIRGTDGFGSTGVGTIGSE